VVVVICCVSPLVGDVVSGRINGRFVRKTRGRHRALFCQLDTMSELHKCCSPGWTRTSNPSVNSRMLCQLSYRGLTPASGRGRDAREDFSARAALAANTPPPRADTGK
jgi:hypothetical protein